MLLPLTATRLVLGGRTVEREPIGDVQRALVAYLSRPEGAGLVLLGAFGSGKTTLCATLATRSPPGCPPCSVAPLRVVARHADLEQGLIQAIGATRLAEARAGERVVLLDGLDEIGPALTGKTTFAEFYHEVTARVGPRWVVTGRPGWFRTEVELDADQVDTLTQTGLETWVLDPLPPRLVHETIAALPGGEILLRTVEGMREIATSPVLFQALHAALPFIEPGRPIHPWGVFDAWIRHALHTGPRHDEAVCALEELAWQAFEGAGRSLEVPLLAPTTLADHKIPDGLRRALFVNEWTGGLRFGHRSVYEYLLAARVAPALARNQGQGPDSFTGMRLSEATRAFVVGRTGPMGVEFDKGARRARIPAGNFIAGGEHGADERPLRIVHLAQPFWLARTPVTNREWSDFLAAVPDDRVDANYLVHWGVERQLPSADADAPIHHIWPDDADRYAQWAGARLPSADEWEKAVRGIDGRQWPWGDWWKPAAVVAELGVSRPLAVRALGASGEAALFSAIGGVFEYTSSWYRNREDRGRIVMGGCYTHPASVSRASLRLSHRLSGNLKAGFRLAYDAEPAP
jgi:formylglycine-generating enzyme required for sulfatase activity